MSKYNPHQCIEIFHLLFLKQLESKMDKSFYALKGGCNLRFFFKSIRYSEDMDFDVKTIAVETLKSKVNKILEQRGFLSALQTRKIRLVNLSAPKQTGTTQRWKIQLLSENQKTALPTKIEFSRRTTAEQTEIAAVDNDLILQYQLYPVFCRHYTRQAAAAQKLNALLHRKETQARDIFDLNLLLNAPLPLSEAEQKNAQSLILSIDYPVFKSQVVNYLLPDYRKHFDSREKWREIQNNVLSKIV